MLSPRVRRAPTPHPSAMCLLHLHSSHRLPAAHSIMLHYMTWHNMTLHDITSPLLPAARSTSSKGSRATRCASCPSTAARRPRSSRGFKPSCAARTRAATASCVRARARARAPPSPRRTVVCEPRPVARAHDAHRSRAATAAYRPLAPLRARRANSDRCARAPRLWWSDLRRASHRIAGRIVVRHTASLVGSSCATAFRDCDCVTGGALASATARGCGVVAQRRVQRARGEHAT